MRFSVLLLVCLLIICCTASENFQGPKFKFREEYIKRNNIDRASLPKGKPLTPTKKYDTSAGYKEGAINVHMVPHTHDDVGWLKTVDEYFVGLNNTIQVAGVQYILDSVMVSLGKNPDRKFIYVEMAFFKRWWDEQDSDTRAQVKKYVANGQLEFINGGWCMSDEAAPFYVDMIDQQTCGHLFLTKTFGDDVLPKTGWQIDPFGHSSFMGTAFALMGMDSWFFGRIDYQDRDVREKTKTAEVIMRPSASLNPADVDIFTGVTRGYGALPGFDFELSSADPPVQDDPNLEDYNLQQEIDDFVAGCLEQNSVYKTDNIMLTMGTDFNYMNAHTWYKQMDKLIHYVNEDGRVNLFYSTPTLYTEAKNKANATWALKTDDWFPYADAPHAFWTGYFTSRPALKGYVRSTSNFLQACRQIEVQTQNKSSSSSSQLLWEALGLAQHHDAVSGTSKQHVAYDYAKALYKGYAECMDVIAHGLGEQFGQGSKGAPVFEDCPLRNESICPATTTGTGNVAILVYNPLAKTRYEPVSFPVAKNASFTIIDADKNNVAVDILSSNDPSDPNDVAVFLAEPQPMGYSTYVMETSTTKPVKVEEEVISGSDDPYIENSQYKVVFSGETGHMVSISNKVTGNTVNMIQTWGWYNASTGNVPEDQNRYQASGAYIFRPNCTENVPTPCFPYNIPTNKVAKLSVQKGTVVQTATQTFADWLVQTVRLYQGHEEAFVEVEYMVGPVPIDDNLGKEVVSVWSTDMNTDNTWYTDSNGRDMQKRVMNYRPTWTLNVTDPVSGNFYPVNSAISMVDGNNSFTILTDRSQAGASLGNGELELMVHRRLLVDDHRGVGEPLDEPGLNGKGLITRGIQRVIFNTFPTSTKLHRVEQEKLTFRGLPLFATIDGQVDDFLSKHNLQRTGVQTNLPQNIHLLTMQDNSYYGSENTMILRLSHNFESNENPDLSVPETVDFSTLFTSVKLSNCVERSLSANQDRASIKRMSWNIDQRAQQAVHKAFSESTGVASVYKSQVHAGVVSSVTINPMEIRTFICDYSL